MCRRTGQFATPIAMTTMNCEKAKNGQTMLWCDRVHSVKRDPDREKSIASRFSCGCSLFPFVLGERSKIKIKLRCDVSVLLAVVLLLCVHLSLLLISVVRCSVLQRRAAMYWARVPISCGLFGVFWTSKCWCWWLYNSTERCIKTLWLGRSAPSS